MDIQNLKNRADQIRTEKKIGANTAERVGGLMSDMIAYSLQNRQHLNGDSAVSDANKYPFLAIYIDNPATEYNDLNAKLNDIALMATPKYNGNLRFYLSGVRIDVINRVLNFGNKTTSQMVFGPLQPTMAGTLEYTGNVDQILRRQYKNGGWSQWEVIRPAEVGFRSSGSFSEVFNATTNVASGAYSHAEGFKTNAAGVSSHAEGDQTTASADMAHAEGVNNVVSARGGHAEGGDNRIESADGSIGRSSAYAHVEGWNNQIGPNAPQAHVEGSSNFAGGKNAHVEGLKNRVNEISDNVHVEGSENVVNPSSTNSHVEGLQNINEGASEAHIEGKNNTTKSGATAAHVEGGHNIVNNTYEHACGRYNASTKGRTLYSVGAGNAGKRFNAIEVDFVGNVYVYGVGGYDGTNASIERSLRKELLKLGQYSSRIVDLTPYIDAIGQADIVMDHTMQFVNPSIELKTVILMGFSQANVFASAMETGTIKVACIGQGAEAKVLVVYRTPVMEYNLMFASNERFDYLNKFLASESKSIIL